MHQYLASAASGAIIANKRKSYILTAGHVCSKEAYKAELEIDHIKVRYRVTDAHGITHKARLFKLDEENDICLLVLNKRLNLPSIKLRFHGPVYGEKVYNLASPTGFSDKNYVPLLEGRYSGFNAYRMIFTVPAIGGSSGSPLFDEDGQLVGMIIAVHIRFPMISFSPHFHALEEMIDSIKH
jgi:S1-C subfamily serine protease